MKDRTILALKGIAIIGVVLHHVGNRRLDPQLLAWEASLVIGLHWCVLGFIMISGYLQAMSDSKKQRPFVEFTRTRILRLLVPFVLLVIFYSAIWQLLQALPLPSIAVKIPPDFLGKVESGLWPVGSQVAEQLYFFPLLFGVVMVLFIVRKLFGILGMWTAAIVSAVPGLTYCHDDFTGFRIGVFFWGLSFYACGYLLYHYRERRSAIRVTLLIVTVIFIVCNSGWGILRCVPLWLLAEGATLRLDRVPLLVNLGEASGTIYIYHTPFLIRFLVIGTTYLPGKVLQFIVINLDAVIAIGLCYLLHESLKNTRAKIILM